MPSLLRLALLVVAVGVASEPSAYAVWTKLLGEGDLLPGADLLPGFNPNETMRSNGFREVTVAPNGNFVGTVSTDPSADFGSEDWYLFGSTERGENPRALRREGLYDGQTQTTLSTPSGIDNAGQVYYGARLASAGEPNATYSDDQLVFTAGDPITAGPLAGSFFTSFSQRSLTPDGVAQWTSGYSDTAGGVEVGRAIFRDTVSQQVLLKSGDSIGFGLNAEPETVAGNLYRSASGDNYLTKIKVAQNPFPNPGNINFDEALVLNGQVLTTFGGVLRDGEPIPPAAGGEPNQTWSIGAAGAINEAGDWAHSAAAQLNGAGNSVASFLLVNGEIRYRAGEVLDGVTLSGSLSSVSMNDRGDFAFVWGNTVFLNDEVLIAAGDLVDTTGDGAGDTALTNLFDVTLTNLPSADGGPLLYFEGRLFGNIEILARSTPVTLAGDYNGDGVVDAADYTVWRDNEGSELLLAADGDQDNVIGAGDRVVWADAYGSAVGSSTAVPEPLGVRLIATAMLSALGRRLGASRN